MHIYSGFYNNRGVVRILADGSRRTPYPSKFAMHQNLDPHPTSFRQTLLDPRPDCITETLADPRQAVRKSIKNQTPSPESADEAFLTPTRP